jgi:hypothetical protein
MNAARSGFRKPRLASTMPIVSTPIVPTKFCQMMRRVRLAIATVSAKRTKSLFADELILPNFSSLMHPNGNQNVVDNVLARAFTRLLTEKLAVSVDSSWIRRNRTSFPQQAGFGLDPERSVVRISQDGTRIAFRAPVDGVLNLWVAPLDGIDEARPVTAVTDRNIGPWILWMHDNRHVVTPDPGVSGRTSPVCRSTRQARQFSSPAASRKNTTRR